MPSVFKVLAQILFRGDATGSGNAIEIADSSGTTRLTVANQGGVTVGTNAAITTQTAASITASTTNASLVIAPNGTGALIADTPDGAAAGGNARGNNATDLQTARGAATEVASGLNATLTGGANNTASASYSSVAGGFESVAYLYGQRATASGKFAANSDAQTSALTYRAEITGIAIAELFLNGTSERAVLSVANARAWRAQIDLVAICHTVGNGTTVLDDCFMGSYHVGIKRVAAVTSLVGAVSVTNEVSDASMATAVVTIDADDTNEALRIQFTPPTTAGTTTVIRVVATAYITEVGR